MSSIFKRFASFGLILALIILTAGCASVSKSPKPVKPSPVESAAFNFFLSGTHPEYTLNAASEDNPSYKLKFPELSGFKGELVQDYINQTLYNEAFGMVSPDATPKNPLTVTYTVTRQDAHILSLVYTGTLKKDGHPFEMKSGVTIDLKSGNSINTTNIIKSDETSQKNFSKLFASLASSQKLDNNKLDEFMSMNLDDKNLNFFFLDSETATKYSTVAIPLEQILPDLNMDFGEVPVS